MQKASNGKYLRNDGTAVTTLEVTLLTDGDYFWNPDTGKLIAAAGEGDVALSLKEPSTEFSEGLWLTHPHNLIVPITLENNKNTGRKYWRTAVSWGKNVVNFFDYQTGNDSRTTIGHTTQLIRRIGDLPEEFK